ncbi:MAG: DUF6090 family protein [Verrucomicrobia bacterium]|nr:DUF6090 family protein [Verrucomicrobiota bacterium]
MFRFFRRIRQKLFLEGRVSRYFGYAIGEIVLIVVGILIALQINDWNEQRKDKVTAVSLLGELKAELLYDLDRLEEMMLTLNQVDEAGLYLSKFLSGSIDNVDANRLLDSFWRAGHNASISFTDVAYNSLISSGKIDSIKNDSLKRKLAYLHNDKRWGKKYHDEHMQQVYNDYQRFIHRYSDTLFRRTYFQRV